MKTLTMYRYSITGSFGYSCHLNDEEIIHISGAPLPNNPVHIFGHSVKFKSEMQSALSRMPKSAQDNAKERMITNEHNEIVAVLNRMSDSFSLVYQNRMISIVCTETRFVFTEAQRELAFITRAKDKSVPPRRVLQMKLRAIPINRDKSGTYIGTGA